MIRYALLIAGAVFALPFAATAEERSAHQHPMQMPAAKGEVGLTDGTVRKVDKAAGEVVIAHGPLDNIGMSAMTMAFRVKDAKWLTQMKPGDRIRFVADFVKGDLTVVRYEAAR